MECCMRRDTFYAGFRKGTLPFRTLRTYECSSSDVMLWQAGLVFRKFATSSRYRRCCWRSYRVGSYKPSIMPAPCRNAWVRESESCTVRGGNVREPWQGCGGKRNIARPGQVGGTWVQCRIHLTEALRFRMCDVLVSVAPLCSEAGGELLWNLVRGWNFQTKDMCMNVMVIIRQAVLESVLPIPRERREEDDWCK